MSKREVCSDCGFILVRCLCESLESINNETELIILQHHSETKHALNTVTLMKKSFQKIHVLVGEDFSHQSTLNSLIGQNADSIALLFPNEASSLLKTDQPEKKITHLILIDGTWKKAHKIFMLSKNLHSLPSFKLELTEPGLYQIRSSKLEHSLSTLEASIQALKILENKLDTTSLKKSFVKMIEFQIEKMGAETFSKNYQKKSGSKD